MNAPHTRSVMETGEEMSAAVERMIAEMVKSYPDDWSDSDKREAAIHHLFGATGALTHEGVRQ